MLPIIDKLGGRLQLFEKLVDSGLRVKTKEAVRMWEQRGQMPGNAIVHCMELAEKEGVSYSSKDFRPKKKERRAATSRVFRSLPSRT